jgi:hypothetical protein
MTTNVTALLKTRQRVARPHDTEDWLFGIIVTSGDEKGIRMLCLDPRICNNSLLRLLATSSGNRACPGGG